MNEQKWYKKIVITSIKIKSKSWVHQQKQTAKMLMYLQRQRTLPFVKIRLFIISAQRFTHFHPGVKIQ